MINSNHLVTYVSPCGGYSVHEGWDRIAIRFLGEPTEKWALLFKRKQLHGYVGYWDDLEMSYVSGFDPVDHEAIAIRWVAYFAEEEE